jgi:hypothetical protein
MNTIKHNGNANDEDPGLMSQSDESDRIVLTKNTLRGKLNTIKYD